ncbi:NHL repeat-containing protein [Leptospira perolatii]|nr:NHL repeat-containing protein [Leptospira perolatii]
MSADTLNGPFKPALAPDGSGIYLADQLNARALFYPGISTTATRVYGTAGSFAVPGNTGTTSSTFDTIANVPEVFADPTGVYISDIQGNRILFFPGTSATATRVYGQFGQFTCAVSNNVGACITGSPTTNGIANPQGIYSDASGVYIVDTNNHRVLFYPGTSTTATRVYGQFDFSSGLANAGATVSAAGLNQPRGLWVDASGVYVADVSNHRVLFYPGTSTTPSRVYGQPDFNSANPGTTATSLNNPWYIRSFFGKVYIADTWNNRVLEFEGTSTTATKVWGQAENFTTNAPNVGGISAATLNQPYGLEMDLTGLYVADSANNRMLFYPR